MTESYLLKERRVHPRIAAKVPLEFKVLDDQEEIKNIHEKRKKEKNSQAMDVSLGGIFIMSDQPLREGNILNLEIAIPGAPDKLKAIVEVVWSNETGGGIQFLAMAEPDVEALKAYLDKVSTSR